MELQHGHERFWTAAVQDNEAGYIGLELYRERFGHKSIAARLIFWDAAGGYTVETVNGDVPIEVMEAAFNAVRQHVRIKLRPGGCESRCEPRQSAAGHLSAPAILPEWPDTAACPFHRLENPYSIQPAQVANYECVFTFTPLRSVRSSAVS